MPPLNNTPHCFRFFHSLAVEAKNKNHYKVLKMSSKWKTKGEIKRASLAQQGHAADCEIKLFSMRKSIEAEWSEQELCAIILMSLKLIKQILFAKTERGKKSWKRHSATTARCFRLQMCIRIMKLSKYLTCTLIFNNYIYAVSLLHSPLVLIHIITTKNMFVTLKRPCDISCVLGNSHADVSKWKSEFSLPDPICSISSCGKYIFISISILLSFNLILDFHSAPSYSGIVYDCVFWADWVGKCERKGMFFFRFHCYAVND